MAVENRANIIAYIVEEYKRMAAAASILLNKDIEPDKLWINTHYLSTDSVSKNHSIGQGVADALGSSHVPIHSFCKSHTAGEGIDAELIKTLTFTLENPLKLRAQLEKLNPSLRMYFRHQSVVQAGMRALTKLVTPDKSANSCSLSEHFDQLCDRQGHKRKLTLYKERRFGKLGSCAAALLQALPLLTELLDESPANNLLAQAARIYVRCDIIITELRMLAYFGQQVVMPFLNCIEKVNGEQLMQIQKKMHQDLLRGDSSTLKPYTLAFHSEPVQITGELETKLHKVN